MSLLILFIAIAFIAWMLWMRFQKMRGQVDRATMWRYALIGAGVVLLIIVFTGRANALFAVIGAALAAGARWLPMLLRYAPMLQSLFGQVAGTARLSSSMLRLEIDPANGRMDGEVLDGPLAGRRLSTLDPTEVEQLLAQCKGDLKSYSLLQAWLQRERGFARGAGAPPPAQPGGHGIQSREEALAILGLEPDADKDAVVQAHRRLMGRLHPDKGGSDYLATRINQARDYLLG